MCTKGYRCFSFILTDPQVNKVSKSDHIVFTLVKSCSTFIQKPELFSKRIFKGLQIDYEFVLRFFGIYQPVTSTEMFSSCNFKGVGWDGGVG